MQRWHDDLPIHSSEPGTVAVPAVREPTPPPEPKEDELERPRSLSRDREMCQNLERIGTALSDLSFVGFKGYRR